MRILVLIDSFGRGGAERSTALFVLKLNALYDDMDFVCAYLYHYEPGMYSELKDNNIPVIHLNEKGLFRKIQSFRRLIKEYEPDIIHSVLYESNLIKRLASIGLKGVYVESLVNKPYVKEREYQTKTVKYKSKVSKLIDKRTKFLVDHFHAVGYAVASHYKKIYGNDLKFTVVERGRPVPSVLFQEYSPVELESLVIGTTARQEYQKGLIYLLRAILPFKERVKVRIIGREGSATPQLKKFIEENKLENTVTFFGFIENVTEEIAKVNVYISTSLYEGLPGSVIEAMSVKKPLLLSDIEEHREVAIANENALFFKPRDIEGIRHHLNNILNNKIDLESLGNRSFEIFNSKFTEDSMVNGMADFYRRMIKLKK